MSDTQRDGDYPQVPRRVPMAVLMDDVPAGGGDEAVNGGRPAGDCLRACVASVLDLDAEEVPHFVQYIDHPEGTDRALWYWALLGFCDAYGWRVNYAEEPPSGWSLADGKSPRGHQHVVVAYDGQVVYDPHPSGAGLDSIDGWFTFDRAEDSGSPTHPQEEPS